MLIDFEELKHKVNNSKWYGTEALYEIIELILECEDKTRPKGKWVRIRMPYEYGEIYCNQCGQEHPEQKIIWNYCPNCGAQMSKEVKVATCDRNKCYENEINGIPCEECECCADMRGEEE